MSGYSDTELQWMLMQISDAQREEIWDAECDELFAKMHPREKLFLVFKNSK